ncbi:MAG: DEAD/DEAH box helicase [Rhodospirillales bacterium]|jgi:ATP-dependent RNA helicase RhlE|nr:DEAD/DEAH box helicase [Rhodospirillales bacterium]
MTDFSGLGLASPILKAVEGQGYSTPSPIQAKAIPHLMEGRDLLGVAQTGTGKTAAFSLPILHRLADFKTAPKAELHPGTPRVLILAPTRELASQIGDNILIYSRYQHIRTAVIFGGVSIQKNFFRMRKPVDILVATPGRLLDLMARGSVKLNRVETFVLDEADRMLDMGFIPDVRKITAKLPGKRQTLLFSATMPDNVRKLANDLLNDPVEVEVAPAATTAERVDQRVLFVPKAKKQTLLAEILKNEDIKRVLVFSRTKHGADRIAKNLDRSGIKADAIHGNKSQNARERALNSFRGGNLRVLVATDIAARGIDVDGITHVINFDLPNEPESYVHRIGRTARAGADGMAISFCDADERAYLKDIEKTIRQRVFVDETHPYHNEAASLSPTPKKAKGQKRFKPSAVKKGGPSKHRSMGNKSSRSGRKAA